MDDQHDRHSVHLIVYHLIFCPQRRRRVLLGAVQKRLERVIAERGWFLLERAIQPDHVHLFVRTNPSTLPSAVPRLIKGRSSRLLRREFAHLRKLPTLWTHSYFLSTAGNVSSETTQRYIEHQSESQGTSLPSPPIRNAHSTPP